MRPPPNPGRIKAVRGLRCRACRPCQNPGGGKLSERVEWSLKAGTECAACVLRTPGGPRERLRRTRSADVSGALACGLFVAAAVEGKAE